MATHNRRRFVPEAIACFLAQTIPDSELIIVDNGDDLIMDLIPQTRGRIHYLPLMGHRYHFCELRDLGIQVARGKYLAVWDDDDLSHPERLAVQVAALEHSGKKLCLLGSSVVTREDPPGAWVYTPRNAIALDNSAVFLHTPEFRFYSVAAQNLPSWLVKHELALGTSSYLALRALKAAFGEDCVTVDGRPELLTTRMHGANTCQRPCGEGPEWVRSREQ